MLLQTPHPADRHPARLSGRNTATTRTNASNRQTQWVGLGGQTVGANVETRIASSGGDQVYEFNVVGKHARTIVSNTQATIVQFGYDASGRLPTIPWVSGPQTTVPAMDSDARICAK